MDDKPKLGNIEVFWNIKYPHICQDPWFAEETIKIQSEMKEIPTVTIKAQQVFGHLLHELSDLHLTTHMGS